MHNVAHRIPRQQRGFSLVEAVITVSIVAIISGVVGNSVMKVRENVISVEAGNTYVRALVDAAKIARSQDKVAGVYLNSHSAAVNPTNSQMVLNGNLLPGHIKSFVKTMPLFTSMTQLKQRALDVTAFGEFSTWEKNTQTDTNGRIASFRDAMFLEPGSPTPTRCLWTIEGGTSTDFNYDQLRTKTFSTATRFMAVTFFGHSGVDLRWSGCQTTSSTQSETVNDCPATLKNHEVAGTAGDPLKGQTFLPRTNTSGQRVRFTYGIIANGKEASIQCKNKQTGKSMEYILANDPGAVIFRIDSLENVVSLVRK